MQPTNGVDESVKELVDEHRLLKDGPLHLAIQLSDPRTKKDVILFEVIGGFGSGHIDPSKRFLKVGMATSKVPVAAGGELRFVLTSPEELQEAIAKNWKDVMWLKARLANARVHHEDAKGKRLLKALRGAA